MYGWLTYDNRGLGINFPMWDFEHAPVISDETRRTRNQLVMTVVAPAFADDVALRNAAFSNVQATLNEVDDRFVDYAARMGKAFYLKHRADHAAVRARIARAVDDEFGPIADPRLIAMSMRLKAVTYLVPECLRPAFINEYAAFMRNQLLNDKQPPQDVSAIRAIAPGLEKLLIGWSDRARSAVNSVVADAMISAPASRVSATAQMLLTLVGGRRSDVFEQLELHQQTASAGLSAGLKYRALHRGLSLAAEQPKRRAAEVVAQAFAEMHDLDKRQDMELRRDTLQAISDGLDLGDLTESSLDALRRWQADGEAVRRECMEALVAHAHQRKAARAARIALEPGSVSSEELQTWSIAQLVRWINGPPVGPRRGHIDRRRARGAAPDDAPPHAPQTQPPADEAPPPLDDDDVSFIGNEGYGAVAAFLLDDLQEMLPIAHQLGTDAKLVTNGEAHLRPLQQLRDAPEQAVETEASQRLTEAEAAIAQLRQGMRSAKRTQALQDSFVVALSIALSRETMALGRRRGGVIDCALTMDDWDWVVERLHMRWCPGRRLICGERMIDLAPDEAFVLYVTGSSLSGRKHGYVFDISVHLLRRLPDRIGLLPYLPGAQELFPKADLENWFHTYETCAVLHVPVKK